MRKQFLIIAVALVFAQAGALGAQTKTAGQPAQGARPSSSPARAQTPAPAPPARETTVRSAGSDLTEYGVYFEPEPRLIVMMAALDAAGLDLTPQGAQPAAFRELVRRDLAALSPALRERLRNFYERNKLPAPATPAEQAARYVSLAYALGPPPAFAEPQRSDDLPASVLEVLDFAPLVREFYKQSGIDERLPAYVRATANEGNNLRPATAAMVSGVLSYLHTRPQLSYVERVATPGGSAKSDKNTPERRITLTREHERRFRIVPDLLAAPGALNFRIIGDDYYAIVPQGIDPSTSELRRAYLQFIIDPLVLRFNRDIAARRADIRTLLDELRAKTKNDITPDVFLTVARSLVAAADARMSEQARTNALALDTSARLRAAQDASARDTISREAQATRAAIEDATVAQLADAYERGAVLAFYFAEQLRGLETSGFDIAAFLPDMLASLDAAREGRRPAEYAEARARFVKARERTQRERAAANASAVEAQASPQGALIKSLREADELLRTKNYAEAERRLLSLSREFPGEPRVFFALGQAASLSAEDAMDENLQAERLTRSLGLYRMAVERAANAEDRALVSRARAAMGRILAFLERNEEALKEFDAAIQLGPIQGGAYQEALDGKKRLQP
ncbi:MAG TPA: hypothetical protein VNA19_01925 [Pyrinomonadaceae bacterium]|jgi:hypothetical protein|nr:hypothetical protein [Pyrinomonadaceae bacterium]